MAGVDVIVVDSNVVEDSLIVGFVSDETVVLFN